MPARGTKTYAVFISHYKAEAAMEARHLHEKLEGALGRHCFIDSDDLHDLRKLREAVRDSDCLLLLQSARVLERPWCLVELLTAIDNNVPHRRCLAHHRHALLQLRRGLHLFTCAGP